MRSPPFTPGVFDILPAVGNHFLRAFERGSQANGRPSPNEWLTTLKRLERDITTCPNDPGHIFWRGCQSCTWCRLIAASGPDYFYGVSNRHQTFTVNEAKLQDVQRKLAATQWNEPRYERRHYETATPPVPEPMPSGIEEFRQTSTILGGAACIGLLLVPFGLFHSAISVVGLLFSFIFALWFLIHHLNSPWHREKQRRNRKRNKALTELEEIESEWFSILQYHRSRHSVRLKRVKALVTECRALLGVQKSELQKLASNAEALARERHLKFHLIAGAKIPLIGESRKQTLEQYGIVSAANIHKSAVQNIKGFGPKMADNLMAWKYEVLATFQFNPATAISQVEHKVIVEKLRHRERALHTEIDRLVSELQNSNGHCSRELSKLTDELRIAVSEWEQAEVDLRATRSRR